MQSSTSFLFHRILVPQYTVVRPLFYEPTCMLLYVQAKLCSPLQLHNITRFKRRIAKQPSTMHTSRSLSISAQKYRDRRTSDNVDRLATTTRSVSTTNGAHHIAPHVCGIQQRAALLFNGRRVQGELEDACRLQEAAQHQPHVCHRSNGLPCKGGAALHRRVVQQHGLYRDPCNESACAEREKILSVCSRALHTEHCRLLCCNAVSEAAGWRPVSLATSLALAP